MSMRPAASLLLLAFAASVLVATSSGVTAAAPAPNWGVQSPAASPAGRSYAGMAYDSGRNRTVLFGGGNSTNSTNELNDTWEWDGIRWTQFFPVPAPPVSIGPGMAYDSRRGVTVLLDNNSHTWEWNGASWTQKITADAPSPRVWTSMVYDSADGVMVLFDGSSLLGDTWTYDGNDWTKKSPLNSPSPRYGVSMAFDSAHNVVVLFGGRAAGQRVNDTWTWDGGNWTQLNPTTSPLPRFFGSMAYDAQDGVTELFGGDHLEPGLLGPINDTWTWDGNNWKRDWTSAAPSPRAGQAMVYQSASASTLMFGGSDELNPGTFPTDTWSLAAGIVTPPGNPAVTLNTNNLAFLTTAVGATSAAGTLRLTGAGTGPSLISSINMPADFAIASNGCPTAPDPLAVGAFCNISFTFTSSACQTESGSLTLVDNGPGGSQTIGLLGGVRSATCDGDLLLFPSQDVTAPSTSSSGAVVNFSSPAVNENVTSAPCSPASGSLFPIGTTTVTCSVTDADDATSTVTASFHVTVTDQDLGLAGLPADFSVTTTSPSGAVVSYAPPTAVDEDASSPAVSCSPASGSTFPLGTTTVTCTASDPDDSPGTASATFRVTVNDNDLAFSGVPSGGSVNATSPSGAIVSYPNPVAADEDANAPAVSCRPASGTTFPIGTTTVSCTASDADDTPSTISTSFQITVNDTDLALTGVPANIVRDAFNSAGAAITFTPPAAVDEEGSPAVACDHAAGSTFPIGVTTVTCQASDADDSPSVASGSFTVTIRDTDLGLSGPGDITAVATSAAGAAVAYPAPVPIDEEGTPAVTCDHASGSTFPVGVMTRVTCTAVDADDSPSSFSIGFFVTVIPDMSLATATTPTSATTHATVTTNASVKNIGAASRKVSISYAVTFTDASGATSVVASDKATVTVDPGQTVSRPFALTIKTGMATGSYNVTVTSSDVTGAVTQTSAFTVT